MGIKRKRPADMVTAARQVRGSMEQIDNGISRLANSAGTLLALMDNADNTETLSSVRSDTAYGLVRNLADAYQAMADFLTKEMWD